MIEVLRAGACDLVIDLGRPGWGAQGVPAGGAADPEALAAANALVGNALDAAGLEFAIVGPRLRFPRGATVALTGATARATCAGGAVPGSQTLVLGAGETLEIGPLVSGSRCWLAVAGGIDVEPVLGSASTFLPGGFGGCEGRRLRAGDTLAVKDAEPDVRLRRAYAPPQTACLRVIPGPQLAYAEEAGIVAFFKSGYRVTECDRRGIRLSGPTVGMRGSDGRSQGVLPGAVQVPPDAQPIILGWDGPVTGGYPVIATVASADWAALAQLRAGDAVRFTTVDVEAARALPRSWQIEDIA